METQFLCNRWDTFVPGRSSRIALVFAVLLISGLTSQPPQAALLDGKQTKREEIFKFTEKPRVTRDGDKITIRFAVKANCDATVSIEDEDGRIVRHLASGVLGGNAPAPFQMNALRQTVVWDGKNDKGEYVDDKDSLIVRVSLGLKTRFEKSLFWSPRRRTQDPSYLSKPVVLAPAPEGVYAYDGGNGDHVRLYSHDGDYVRTIYPAPAEKIKEVKGLKWKTFVQDGRKLPVKGGGTNRQHTFLTSGGVASMAAHKGKLALVGQRLNRLQKDGSSGGLPFAGPKTSLTQYITAPHGFKAGNYELQPKSAAFSPDGKWVYITGYHWHYSWATGTMHGVLRFKYGADDKPETFAGVPTRKDLGKDDKHFNYPISVDCDGKGRVYVTDFLNDRIQVFSPEGKLLKSIKTKKPARVTVDRKSGKLYVTSYPIIVVHFWYQKKELKSIKSRITVLKSFDDPKVLSSCALPKEICHFPGGGGGLEPANLTIDTYCDPPRIWSTLGPGRSKNWHEAGIKIYELKKGKLSLKRDLGAESKKKDKYTRAARHLRERLFYDPGHNRLYVGHIAKHVFHAPSMPVVAVINPENGKVKALALPFDPEDMAFDIDGNAYLRTENAIARYDPRTWREVPFDYGEEMTKITTHSLRTTNAISAIRFVGQLDASYQLGGMNVSPKGHVIVTAYNPARPPSRKSGDKRMHQKMVRKYTPQLYPGRARPWEVHVFDKHGKILYEDAVPGMGRMVGIGMDKDDDIYVLACGLGKVGDKLYDNPISCTLVKLKPKTKLLGTKGVIPLPNRPKRAPDVHKVEFAGDLWGDVYWTVGGVGFDGKRAKCHCPSQCRPAFDYLERTFLPEIDRYSVLVVDSNGNQILRFGRYGNVDDGKPLEKKGGPPDPRSIGGDEVALMHAQHLAVHTDRRLFISDLGNARIACVKLLYHEEEKVKLKDVKDEAN